MPAVVARARGVTVEPLARHPQAIAELCGWFEAEWPDWYGPAGRGSAAADLHAYANTGGLPCGVVAWHAGHVCGVAALKAKSIASHAHLSPWAAAGWVHPDLRGRGIGGLLLGALEHEARRLGFPGIHCGTSTAQNLLRRCGWQLMERVTHEGQDLGVYRKAL